MINNQRKRQSGGGTAAARSERSLEYLFPRRYSQPAEKVVSRSSQQSAKAMEGQRRSGSAVGSKRRRRAGPELLVLSVRAGWRGSTRERQSGSGGAGERLEWVGCISLCGVSPPAESEAPGADPKNPPEQGGDGVDAGDRAAAAGRRGGRSRGRRGAVLLSQSGCA